MRWLPLTRETMVLSDGNRSLVYFALCRQLGAVKIGFTTNCPLYRLKTIQSHCPAEVKIVAVVDGWGSWEERLLHKALGAYRVRGEWFRISGAVASAIDFARTGPTTCTQRKGTICVDCFLSGAGLA